MDKQSNTTTIIYDQEKTHAARVQVIGEAIATNTTSKEDVDVLIFGLLTTLNYGDPGICGCGSYMEGHPEPMDCGHSPVNYYHYTIDEWVKTVAPMLNVGTALMREIVLKAEQATTPAERLEILNALRQQAR